MMLKLLAPALLALLTLLPMGAVANPTAITDVWAYLPGKGLTEHMNVVLDKGRIVSVDSKAPPSDAHIVEGKGRILTPGLVEAFTAIGLNEVGLEAPSVDVNELRAGHNHAAFRVSEAYNPLSSVVPVSRMGGITSGVLVPGGALVAGQMGWVGLGGTTQLQALRQGSVAVRAGIGGGGGSRATSLRLLEEALEDARRWRSHRKEVEQRRYRDLSAGPADLEALGPVLDGKQPLVVTVHRAADIEALLNLAKRQKIRLVLAGASEAWLLADRLAAAKVAVVLDPLYNGPGSFDSIYAREDNAVILAEAGVAVAISSLSAWGGHNARKLAQLAGNAVRAGLPYNTAIEAITQTPAALFGLDAGRIEEGARADLVLWDGDPLEVTSAPVYLWVDGVEQPLQSRQTLLLERYRELPGSPSPALPLPK